jgi:CRISPR-associated protein Csx17
MLTPLASYLKALGVLRVVAEQADAEARGWWDGRLFMMATRLDERTLIDFFAARYEPLPPVSPWNKGSGFYGGDRVLQALAESSAPRFAPVRSAINEGRAPLSQIGAADEQVRAIKAETKVSGLSRAERARLRTEEGYKQRLAAAERDFKSLKARLIPDLALQWRGPHREWMDAALVVEDDEVVRFPALLGTGGNDGRLDFTNNYFQRLSDIFDLAHPDGVAWAHSVSWFEQSLFGDPAQTSRQGVAVGQFFPGGAGGANSSNGPEGDSQLNPVDFMLMLEGSVLFKAGLSGRLDVRRSARAAAPFAIGTQAVGYASASEADEGPRGEQWMPVWAQPVTCAEVRRLLSEGRVQVGPRIASEPLDLARAAARLGTARGITAFQRYGYFERNGQSNLAVPLGLIQVSDRNLPFLSCLEDLDAWLPRLHREARSTGTPRRFAMVERSLPDSLIAVTQHADEAARWQEVLLRLANVEACQVSGTGFRAGPVPRLRPEWITAADDASPELRLAVSCALQYGGFEGKHWELEPVRRHWLPLEGSRFVTTGSGSQARLQLSPQQVMSGRSGLDDAVAIVARRLVEAAQVGERRLPLVAARGADATASDLATFILGEVDPDRTLQLARALMAVGAREWRESLRQLSRPASVTLPDDAWIAIRLSMLPWPLPDGRTIPVDPAIHRRLVSGDAASAFDLARQRLRAAGINTTVRAAIVPPEVARRWAAALVFPISRRTASRFVARLDPLSATKEN